MRVSTNILCLLAVSGILASPGCDSGRYTQESGLPDHTFIDAQWLRKDLIDGNARPRMQYGLLFNGFYQPLLGPDWQPKSLSQQSASLITQNRFIYVMAMAYEVTGEPQYRDAMISAADFLLQHFSKSSQPGHWYREVHADGAASNRDFHAYGYTQAIFSLSHAFMVTNDARYRDAALRTWLNMNVKQAIVGQHDYYELRSLNVAMHLFESLLVLYKVSDSEMVKEELQELGDYIVSKFYDPQRGVFVEGLTPTLKRKPEGEIRPGHAIEMAFLLSRAVDVGLPASYLNSANRSVDFVAGLAAENEQGLIPDVAAYDGTVRDPRYYWWSQAELLRGMAHFIWQRGRGELKMQFDESFASVKQHYIDTKHGGWYPRPDAYEEDKGEEWKAGYHVTMMLTELMRIKGERFQSGVELLL